MNDNQIIEALERSHEYETLRYKVPVPPTFILALIKRQKSEIEKLDVELKAMRGAANSYKAEVERLTTSNSTRLREFVDRFKENAGLTRDRVTGIPCYVISKYKLESIVKEMDGQ